jgi:hypothetical protein
MTAKPASGARAAMAGKDSEPSMAPSWLPAYTGQSSHSPATASWRKRMRGSIARARRSRYQAIRDDARWAESVREHGELMAAFARRDAGAATDIWRRHLARTGEVVAARENTVQAAHASPGRRRRRA